MESLHRPGYNVDQANIIADHLIDGELRGLGIVGLGQTLPEDVLGDAKGNGITDPNEAFSGSAGALSAALEVLGGSKGSGLALAAQLLGIMAGSPALPPNLEGFEFPIMLVNPAMFRSVEEFKAEVEDMRDEYHEELTASGEPLRVPFERSDRVRREAKERGWIEVDDGVVERLKALKKDSG